MNKQRRKQLSEAIELIDKARGIISEVYEEENNAFYNLPESLQESEAWLTLEDNA